MIRPLETPRLVLRPLDLADATQVQPLFANWEIVRYLNNRVPWPFPVDGVVSYYRDVVLPAMERGEQWNWTIRPKASPDRIIGNINLMKNAIDNRGFWLGRAWQGQGFMLEACDAATDFWFDELLCPVLRVSKASTNSASRRISEKQGMRLAGSEIREYVCGRLLSQTWEITAGEWRARRGTR